jgi:long-chain-fatty-acyl-CoA reductase
VRLDLPFVISGQRCDVQPEACIELPMAGDNSIRLPMLTGSVVDSLLTASRDVLADVPLNQIIAFLTNVGHNWKSSEYARRRTYISNLQRHRGYARKMAETEANWIAMLLSSHYRHYDQVAAELGSWHVVDEWVPREEAYVRALPRGRVLHVLPGNVPLSSVASIIRALLTKNSSILKVSSEDPLTPIALLLSFMDVDPMHPVSRAMSAVYWPGADTAGPHVPLIRSADALAVWGSEAAIVGTLRHASPEAEIVRFGPRRSVALVEPTGNVRETARALAHDICMYEQRACFSVQEVFVVEPADELVRELTAALEGYRRLLPRGVLDRDELACGSLARLRAQFEGVQLETAPDCSWSVITASPGAVEAHPLGRTVYVHPIGNRREIIPYLDASVQTLAVSPWSLGTELREPCARAGVSRIVELGLNNVFRVGAAHDGMYPLQRLVRFASHELPAAVLIKGIGVAIDQTKFLEEDRFVEFIP